MKEIGATLKKRREELGYTLEEMSNKTRISVAQLKALEDGDLEFFKDDLSYVRYFVRFYCQALYLDFDPLRDQLSQDLDQFTETMSLKAIHVFNHIFFLLKRKFLAKIIGHTINLCNFRLWKHSGNRLNVIIGHYKFNDFIAMFLIVRKIYLFLYRIHVKLL